MLTFREAKDADATTIIQLRQKIWKTTYRGIYPDAMLDHFDTTWHLEKEKSRIREATYLVYLIEENHIPVGYVTLRTDAQIILQSLYVLEEYQSHGIGRAAMAYVRALCRRWGWESFICECHPANWKARIFYEKQGGMLIGADLENEEHWQDAVTYQFQV